MADDLEVANRMALLRMQQQAQQAVASQQMMMQANDYQKAAATRWALYQMQNMYLVSDPKHEAERLQAEHKRLELQRREIFGEDLSDVMAETDRLTEKWLGR